MTNKYLDLAALKFFIAKITEKYDERYLGKHATADAANKVTNAFTVNVGGEAVVFDGSVAKSADVAAAKHTHVAADITDFKTEVRKEVFGAGAGDGVVEIHSHLNKEELDKIADGDVAKWDAMIATGDVARLTYTNASMSGVADVKAALDILAANVVLAAGAMTETSANMKAIENKVGTIENKLADGGAIEDRIAKLEDANKEGGAVAEAIGAAQEAANAAQADVDAVEKRLDDEGGLVDRLEAAEAFVTAQPGVDKTQDDRLAALEKAVNGEGENAKALDEKIADAAQDAADALAKAVEAQGEKDAAQDEAINAKVAQAAYDVKVKALEDEDARIAGLFVTEQGRAEGVEQGLQAAIDAINNADTGILKQAKVYADGLDSVMDERVQVVETIAARLDGAVDVEGSVKKQIKDAIDEVNGAAEDLEERVIANEENLAIVMGEGEGSIKKAVADLVDGAPETLNTLNELAAALRDNDGVLDAIEEAFDNKLEALQKDVDQNKADCAADIKTEQEARAALKTELQGEIDADVKVVADALADEKDVNKEGSLAKKIADEAARADAEEQQIRIDFAAEDAKLQKAIDDIEASLENGEVAQAIEAAQAAAEAAQTDVDALAKYVKGNDLDGKGGIEGRLADVEAHFAEGENSVDAKIAAAQAAAEAEAARLDGLLKQELQVDIANHESRIAANTAALLAIGEPMDEADITAAIGEVFTNL